MDCVVALPKKHHSKQIVLSWFVNHISFTPCPRIAPVGTTSYKLCVFIVMLQGSRNSDQDVAISQWLLNALTLTNCKAHVPP